MQSRYQMSMMGEMNYFLGLQVKQTDDGIFINQSKYTKNLLKKFNLQDCTVVATPMATAIAAINAMEAGIFVASQRPLSPVADEFVERISKRMKQMALASVLD